LYKLGRVEEKCENSEYGSRGYKDIKLGVHRIQIRIRPDPMYLDLVWIRIRLDLR